jgi:lysophospholipase L1-like esterase
VTLANAFTYKSPEPILETDLTLAFGDSITYGTTSVNCDMSPNFYCSSYIPDQAYPVRLRNLLRARYPNQTNIDVLNAGISGECVYLSGCQSNGGDSGGRRFLNILDSADDASDLVVILEGVNDLNHDVSIPAITDRLRQMVQSAKSQGKNVILSSLTPVKAPLDHVNESTVFWKANPDRVWSLNAAIDGLAAAEGVPRVNMFAAFGSGPGALDCNFTPSCRALLSPDGLHPNAAGYARMADVINAKIVEQFEVR